jgi:hypothetical protein
VAISYFGSMTALTGNNPASGTWTLPSAPGGGWTDRYLGIFWLGSRAGVYNITEPTGVGITTKYLYAGGSNCRGYVGYRYLQSGDTTFGWSRSAGSSNSDTIWSVDVIDLGNTGGSGDPFNASSGASPTNFTDVNDPDPPAVTPATNDNLIWTIFVKNNDHTGITAPTNYTNASNGSSTAGTDGCAGTAYRILSGGGGASEDPGAWALSGGAATDDGHAWTGAIAPVSAPGGATFAGWTGSMGGPW